MDFLRIRNEARERAAGKAADAPAAPSREGDPAPGATPAAPAAPSPTAATADAEALEGALAERLGAGEPAAPAPSPAAFATWRPGSGAPPAVPAPPPRAPPPVRLDPADFAVVRPGGAAPIPVPVPVALARAPVAVPPRAGPADPFEGFFWDPEEPPPPGELGEAPPPPRPVQEDAVAREEYLTFLLGAEEYAVAIERVREVLKCPPVTEVPRAPAHVLGVVTVRGEVVPVFEPRRRLGLPSAPPAEGTGRIVIVDAGDGPCGLLVDAVASVVRLLPGSIEPCPQGIGGASQEFLAGIGREGDRLFTVLDLGALLRRPPAPVRRGEGRAHGA